MGARAFFLQQLAILDNLICLIIINFLLNLFMVIESAKLAFADRESFYGDPNFVKVPIDILLSKSYNKKISSNKR